MISKETIHFIMFFPQKALRPAPELSQHSHACAQVRQAEPISNELRNGRPPPASTAAVNWQEFGTSRWQLGSNITPLSVHTEEASTPLHGPVLPTSAAPEVVSYLEYTVMQSYSQR